MKISQTVFNLQSEHEYMVEMAMLNIQRAITPKVGKAELWLMCSAYRLMVHWCETCENISNGIRVIERNYEALTDEQMDTQNFRGYNIIPLHFLWRGIKMV